jgi:outer membrane protein OmpA-like peptidoglycan-associated protein
LNSKQQWFVLENVNFETGTEKFKPASEQNLKNLAEILKAYKGIELKVGGYTDNTGDSLKNNALSTKRAEAAVAQLVALGVEPNRLKPEGYGQQYPVADNATKEGQAQNRRVGFRVTKM